MENIKSLEHEVFHARRYMMLIMNHAEDVLSKRFALEYIREFLPEKYQEIIKPRKKVNRVYIAGPLTPTQSNYAIHYLENVRRMIRLGVEAMMAGFHPYIPALDFHIFLALHDNERITEEMVKRTSIEWLKACDAVLLTPGWEDSPGTLRELKIADEMGIPVFTSFNDLVLFDGLE